MDHRCQIYDDLMDGALSLQDLSIEMLKDMKTDVTLDYNPLEPFFTEVGEEIKRRQALPRTINRDFYK